MEIEQVLAGPPLGASMTPKFNDLAAMQPETHANEDSQKGEL